MSAPLTAADAVRDAAARRLHQRVFGVPPAAVAYAPGRVNLIGEHTDYNGGRSLPIAIDRGATCAVSPRRDGHIAMISAQGDGQVVDIAIADLAPMVVGGWAAYAAGSVAMAIRHGWHAGGVSVSIDGDVPLGAGLSSSAALECSVLLALVAMSASEPEPMAVALAAQQAEHEYAGVPCGILDQATSMLARAGEALVLDSGELSVQSVPLNLAAMGLGILIVDTNARHELSDGGYASRRAACEAAASALGVAHLADLGSSDLSRVEHLPDPLNRRARHVVTEHERVSDAVAAFAAGDRATLGRLFAASHRSLAADFEVSCEELDLAVASALDAGAAAARMTGGGFGGSAVVLCEPVMLGAIRAAVTAAFDVAGFAAPSFLEVVPSRGAHVLSTAHGTADAERR